jgi:hypothetical protein
LKGPKLLNTEAELSIVGEQLVGEIEDSLTGKKSGLCLDQMQAMD